MALDPNIALGVRPIEIANPLAQYGQIAQLQAAQNQNQLAQYQLGAAQRQDIAQNALSAAYKSAFNPETGAVDNAMVLKSLANAGAGHMIPEVQAKLFKAEQEKAGLKKTQTETTGLEFKQRIDKANKAISDIAALNSPQEAMASIDQHLANGDIDQQKADMLKSQLTQAPSFGAWQKGMLVNILDAKDKLTAMLPKVHRQDIGGSIVNIQDNPMLPGYGQPVSNMPGIKKTATIGEQTGQARLAFEREKFNFEKANPGYELKEDADGNFFGVNKRTLQAVPVTVGGGAPEAAPAVSGAGIPTGMRQLTGKGTALTESQGNAAAYGMRMKEANSILAPLEKAGVKNTGLVSGVVGSTLGIVPLIGDKLEGMSGSVFNALPQILGGLSPEQQKVAQARINFITAVLRKESGASISPSEFTTAEKNYFPKPGDDASVVAQKQKARELAIKAMGIQAGPGAKNIEQYVPSGAAGAPTVSNW
jgi:hypothetical protein